MPCKTKKNSPCSVTGTVPVRTIGTFHPLFWGVGQPCNNFRLKFARWSSEWCDFSGLTAASPTLRHFTWHLKGSKDPETPNLKPRWLCTYLLSPLFTYRNKELTYAASSRRFFFAAIPYARWRCVPFSCRYRYSFAKLKQVGTGYRYLGTYLLDAASQFFPIGNLPWLLWRDQF